ncbi:MAG: MFS transporter [Rhodospirillales bacterium]|nr:MFS transporter [Rhodospirillales bacterium]
MSAPPVSRALLLYYALPAFALAMPTIPAYVYLPSFYADLGLGLAAVGVTLLAARIFDVITDPLIGVISDKLHLRWGRRRPWVVAGAVVAGAGLLALFQPPDHVSAAYLLLWSIVLYLGWTMIAVPYTAWGAELSSDYHQRSRITGAREMAMVLGIVAAGSLPAIAAGSGASERDGLVAVAWLAICVGAPTIALLVWRVPEAVSGPGHRADWPRRADIAAMRANKPFIRLLGGWFINGLANGLPAALFPLYLQYGLQADAVERGVLIVLYFISGVAAIPLWVRLSGRLGKHRTWCVAMAVACAAFIWVPFLGPGDLLVFAAICIVTGVALGADLALPPAMQADVVDLDTLRTGAARAGLFFALWSMATKLALALAVGIAFPALAAFGFAPGEVNEAGAILALAVIYAGVPTVLKVCAVALIWRHPLTERRQNIIRRRLSARHRRLSRD